MNLANFHIPITCAGTIYIIDYSIASCFAFEMTFIPLAEKRDILNSKSGWIKMKYSGIIKQIDFIQAQQPL